MTVESQGQMESDYTSSPMDDAPSPMVDDRCEPRSTRYKHRRTNFRITDSCHRCGEPLITPARFEDVMSSELEPLCEQCSESGDTWLGLDLEPQTVEDGPDPRAVPGQIRQLPLFDLDALTAPGK
jgi:hypothetical protein